MSRLSIASAPSAAKPEKRRSACVRKVDALLAAYVTTKSTRAYNKLYLATVGADGDGPLVRRARKNCRGMAGAEAAAQEIAQNILMDVLTMKPSDLATYKSNLFYVAKRTAQMARRGRRAEVYGLNEDGDDETTTLWSRRVERTTFEAHAVHTPESAAMVSQAARRAGVEVSIPLTTSGWAASRVGEGDEVAGLQPKAQDVLRALVAMAHEGEEPTTRTIMARARCDSDGGVRAYLGNLRDAGWVDTKRNVIRPYDGETVPPNPLRPAPKPAHGLPPAQVRMLSAYVTLGRETGRVPSHEAILARVERDTGRAYADAARPLKCLAKAGYIDAETGAVLRTLDGTSVPVLEPELVAEVVELRAVDTHAVESTTERAEPKVTLVASWPSRWAVAVGPETEQAEPNVVALHVVESKVEPTEVVEPTLSPEEIERRAAEDRVRRSLTTTDRRGIAVRNLFHTDPLRPRLQSAPERGDHPAAVRSPSPVAPRGVEAPPAWMIAQVDQAAEYQRENRPRVFAAAWAPLPLGLRGPGAGSGPPAPSVMTPPPMRAANCAMDAHSWWDAREREISERALSFARDVELDAEPEGASELRFPDEGPERSPARRHRRRSRPRRGDGDL